MVTGPIRFRLLRGDDRPATNPHNFTYLFGLQDKAQEIVPPTILADGRLAAPYDQVQQEGHGYFLTFEPDSLAEDDIVAFRSWIIAAFSRNA